MAQGDIIVLQENASGTYDEITLREDFLGIWTDVQGAYVSASTFSFNGTDKDVSLIKHSLFTCLDSGGSTRKVGYIKSASITGGIVTATVITDQDLASGDQIFNIAFNRKMTDYIHLINIPGEIIADAVYSQGAWLLDLKADSFLLPVDSAVITAAAGTGAACTWNIYKDATALFSSAPDMTTNNTLNENRPTTKAISATDNVSLRILTSAGATNKASDFQAKLYIIPQSLFIAY